MEKSNVTIVKADGEREVFDPAKLERSLTRAGAGKETIAEISKHIVSEIHDGMSTHEIYSRAFDYLREKEVRPVAARYSLKRAILALGPSGFPFEDFVSEIFRAKGYEVMTGVMTKGKCAEHEVDLIATSEKDSFGAEVKFHNSPGMKTDLKVALYVRARFVDLAEAPEKKGEKHVERGMLITNTKFTGNAIEYGNCVGLTMIGWNYPEKGNLQDLVAETGLHPITCLTTLSESEKQRLLEDKLVLCRSIKGGASVLTEHGITPEKAAEAMREAQDLCTSGVTM